MAPFARRGGDRWVAGPRPLCDDDAYCGATSSVPYVDNGNIIGLNKTSVQRTLSEVISDLTGSGFKVHEQVDATELNLVGIVFDCRRRTLRLTHR